MQGENRDDGAYDGMGSAVGQIEQRRKAMVERMEGKGRRAKMEDKTDTRTMAKGIMQKTEQNR